MFKEFKSILNLNWIYAQHCVTSNQGDQEGFSVSMLEAAFFGLPVVSTLHNGIPENVLNNKTGLLVNEYDFEEMARKIIELLDNKLFLEKIGNEGRSRVIKNFDIRNRIKSINSLLYEFKK